MADKVKVRFDPEGDFLEVQFRDAPGYMRETANDAVMSTVRSAQINQPPLSRQSYRQGTQPIAAPALSSSSYRPVPVLSGQTLQASRDEVIVYGG